MFFDKLPSTVQNKDLFLLLVHYLLFTTYTDNDIDNDNDFDNNNDSDTVPSNSTTTSMIATAINGPTVYVHLPII